MKFEKMAYNKTQSSSIFFIRLCTCVFMALFVLPAVPTMAGMMAHTGGPFEVSPGGSITLSAGLSQSEDVLDWSLSHGHVYWSIDGIRYWDEMVDGHEITLSYDYLTDSENGLGLSLGQHVVTLEIQGGVLWLGAPGWEGFTASDSTTLTIGTTPPTNQIVYLNFSEETTPFSIYHLSDIDTKPAFSAADFGLDPEQTSSIIQDCVQEIHECFAPYRIAFVTERPSSEPYATVHIGGTTPFYLSSPGLAEGTLPYGVDYENLIKNDNAWIWTKSLIQGNRDQEWATRYLANAISHELGHILGLWHAWSDTENLIMYNAGGSPGHFGKGQIIVTNDAIQVPYEEDGDAYLKWILGTSVYEPGEFPKPVSYDKFFTDWFGLNPWILTIQSSILSLPIYDVNVRVLDTEMGIIYKDIDFGNLNTGDILSIVIPVIKGAKGFIVISGASEPKGNKNIFGVLSGQIFDPHSNDISSLLLEIPSTAGSSEIFLGNIVKINDNETSEIIGELNSRIVTPNNPPIANTGPNQTAYAWIDGIAEVNLDGSGSYDDDNDILTYKWSWTIDGNDYEADGVNPTVELPLGAHTIELVVNDGIEDSEPDDVMITVLDNTPPELTVLVTPNVLWPPNHKMVQISSSKVVSDNCDDSPTVTLISIVMNEGEETNSFDPTFDYTLGDGHTINDIQIINGNIYLRAERSGTGTGSVYTLSYKAVDDSGNVAIRSATVTVPHNQP